MKILSGEWVLLALALALVATVFTTLFRARGSYERDVSALQRCAQACSPNGALWSEAQGCWCDRALERPRSARKEPTSASPAR